MQDELVVALNGTDPLDASTWELFLDGRPFPDLSDTAAISDNPRGLVFTLHRTDKNKAAWTALLGSPTVTREVEVSVARTDKKDALRLAGSDPTHPVVFQLRVLWTPWLFFASVIAAAMLFSIGYSAVRSAILRDSLLPQIPWEQRTFSLGRCQMAFWFTLIIVSFLFLWALLWDYDTVTSQALILMGISASTGLGALAANTTNNDALTNADKALRADGFNSPDDIQSLVNNLQIKLRNVNPQAPDPTLNTQIQELQRRKAVYDSATKDYISATYDASTGRHNYVNIWDDLISDQDGPALHRLQVVGWTVALGLVFIIGIYRDLSMPEFSATLLALMGVSGASYVGFKFPEKT
jgi:hypothetical protein